jgi:hypothetical protein
VKISTNDLKDQVIHSIDHYLKMWDGFTAINKAMKVYPDVGVYLAGGVVRDAVRHSSSEAKDFDFFLRGQNASKFIEVLKEFGELSYGPFGSPRWTPANCGVYADLIRIDRFNNGLEKCETIEDALNQFDFTANAVAVDLRSGAFFDPCGGVCDLQNHVLRQVRFDFPDEPIAKDHQLTRLSVLWMRLMHYSNVLHLEPDIRTKNWLIAHKKYVKLSEAYSRYFFCPKLEGISLDLE